MANWSENLEYADGYWYDSVDDSYYVKSNDGLYYEQISGDAYDKEGNLVDSTKPVLGDTLLNLLNLGIQYGSQQIDKGQSAPIRTPTNSSNSNVGSPKKKSILTPILIGSGILVLGATVFYFVRKK